MYKATFKMHLHHYESLKLNIDNLLSEKDVTPEKICDWLDDLLVNPKVNNPITFVAWNIFRALPNYNSKLEELYKYCNDDHITTVLVDIIKDYIALEYNKRLRQ